MAGGEIEYLSLMSKVLSHGRKIETRNGIRTCLFGEQIKFDLRDGYPLLTTKKIHFPSVKVELLWMLKGLTSLEYLHKHGITIWDEWADERGELGPVYGHQWRSNGSYTGPPHGIDQIANVIKSLETDPWSTRHIVDAWEPEDIEHMELPPCHFAFQFHVNPGEPGGPNDLSCHMVMRSADLFLGVPFNIASYALLTELVARRVGMKAAELTISFGNVHLYENHIPQAIEQLRRTPLDTLPDLRSQYKPELWDYEPKHIQVMGYKAHEHIPAQVVR
jgi:thymidylate synthase